VNELLRRFRCRFIRIGRRFQKSVYNNATAATAFDDGLAFFAEVGEARDAALFGDS
jgi:hypothetical protein